ncbi:MAG: ATP-dependent zinc metalloprotease FtsH [Anaerolineales bacterium]|nr:ATP-dependent zinc metalloprotease FtsH [Anaerolineales bacterium]MCB8953535.1 ATP-dependent metallopeptidase FtsH/Yme1/Tma family protein [Ardenticatenales bacterium]
MDEQQNNRSTIPPWVWIVTAILLILGAQIIFSGGLNTNEVIPFSEVVAYVEDQSVERLTVSGNRLTVILKNGSTYASVKDEGADIFQQLQASGVDTAIIGSAPIYINDASGRTTFFSILFSVGPIILLIWIFSRGLRQMQGGGNNIFGFGRSRARNINEGDRPTVTFDDVAGVDEAKEEVREIVQFLKEPEKFIQVGARIPKGLLMVGHPGTGKTLLARAIAGEAGVPFFHISGSEFVEMFVGVGASRVRDLFNKAKENAPSIVFVDEIDAVGRQRGAGLGGGHDEREQTLNQILVEMDGFSNETNIIVIAATNRPDVLDPALLRPGRFDRKVIVDLPDIKGREEILKVHARGKPIASDVDFNDIARLSVGFAGADLENLVNEAAIFAARQNKRQIDAKDFQDAFDRVVMGPERKSRVISDADKETVAYHEAGHAIVSFFLPNADTVQKITIIPRGQAGGYMMPLPEESIVKTREYFEDQIAVTLGGRAAEEVFFNRLTTGASSDLRKATEVARDMIMRYGMSSELGLRTYGDQTGNIFLGRDMTYGRDYSEEAARAIDQEVRDILDRGYARAKGIIEEHRDKMVRLAHTLLDIETLDRLTFENLMNA